MSGFGDAVQGGGVAGTTELDANLDGAVLIEDSAGVDFLEIDTANEQVILAAGGAKVGINNADPEGQVHIVEGTESGVAPETGFDTLVLDNAAGPGLTFCSGNNTNGTIAFRTENSGGSDSYAMFIQARQTSSGSNYIGQIRLMNGTSANDFLELETAGSSRLRITGQGKITTGGETTSMADDAGSLHIYTGNSGQTDISGNADDLIVEGVENTGLSIACPNDHQGQIAFTANGTSNDRGAITYLHNAVGGGEAMTFRVNDAVRLNISSAGLAKFAGDVEVEKDSPVLTLDNSAASDNSGERSSTIQFKGVATRGSGTATTLGSIRYQHLGSGTGNRAEWVVSVNDSSDSETTDDLNDRLRILGNDGTMRLNGRFQTNDGDAGNPTHSFTSSANSGMFHAGSNSIAFSANGGEKMRITSDGKVGIGEDTPLGADGGSVHIKTADSGVSDASNDCDELIVEGSGNSGISILSGNSSGTTAFGGLAFGRASGEYRGGVNYRHGSSNDYLQFLTAGTTKAIIDKDGQVGIIGNGGTTATAMLMTRSNMTGSVSGTFTATNGSANLTSGSSTQFLSELEVGQAIKVNTEVHTISSIASDTQLTMDGTFAGSTGSYSATTDPTLISAITGDGQVAFSVKSGGRIQIGDTTTVSTHNMSIGDATALDAITTGTRNTAIGRGSGTAITTGAGNVILGDGAGAFVTTGSYNTIIGREARGPAGGGSYNTCIGNDAGNNGVTNDHAVCVGVKAGMADASGTTKGFGDQNTLIGNYAVPGTTGDANSISIGYNATGHGAHTAVIGNSSITQIDPGSDRGANLGQVSYEFDAVHCVSVTEVSDERLKEQIEDTTLGVDFIKRLRPVSYKFKDREAEYETATQTVVDESGEEVEESVQILKQPALTYARKHQGLIAQEVKQVLDDIGMDSSDFGGYVDGNISGNGDRYALRYQQFISPLIKSVQELSSTIETLKTRIEVLENGD